MKQIVKNKSSFIHYDLAKFKKEVNGTYINLSKVIKDNLIKALLSEQGFICAYCMQKINEENSTIEHIIGQKFIDASGYNLGEENQLIYDNLLAVCKGNSCKDNFHCDKSRANFQQKYPKRKLFISPLKDKIIKKIKFTNNGLMYYESFTEIEDIEKLNNYIELDETENIKYDIQKVLNLNCENLKTKRINLIEALRKFTKNWTNKERIRKELNRYLSKSNDEYRELSQVAIYFLSKKL